MLKTALKLAAVPAALLAAAPGTAAVQLVSSSGLTFGTQRGLPTAPWAVDADNSYDHSWLSPGGLLVVSLDPKASMSLQGGPGRLSAPGVELAGVTMAEPMTWAMMLVGLGVVGWSLRDRSRHSLRHISFS